MGSVTDTQKARIEERPLDSLAALENKASRVDADKKRDATMLHQEAEVLQKPGQVRFLSDALHQGQVLFTCRAS
jgi:hypothetical protein